MQGCGECVKNKMVTFSYDDGVTQDIRLIELLNKYDLKCTFNLNSELLGKNNCLTRNGSRIAHYKIVPKDVKSIYEGHEVAVHTLTHPRLTELDKDEIIRQVERDRENLEELVGYEVVGMAYPCGGVNNDDRVAEIIRNNTGVQYSRTITSTYSFDEQDNLFRFNPTIHIIDGRCEEICRRFLEAEFDEPKLLYIWGHSYEFDFDNSWDRFEAICKMISGHDDIFYGTNKEILL